MSLEERGLGSILLRPTYEYKPFKGDEKLFSFLDDISKNNKKVLVHGDGDPDGAFGAKIVLETLKRLGCNNVEFCKYRIKTHILLDEYVYYAIYNKFDYMIIVDSSSQDLTHINELVSNNIKVIIIDHHVNPYSYDDYPENCVMLNTTNENKRLGREEYKLSAGALTFYLLSEYLRRRNVTYKDLSAYALLTLYSDCIDMTRPLNRSIYYMATSLFRDELPIYVRHYLTKFEVFCRRFIEYRFIPQINSLFRSEHMDLINTYLFEEHSYVEYGNILKEIEQIYLNVRDCISLVSDIVYKENLNNFIIANLSDVGNSSRKIIMETSYGISSVKDNSFLVNNLSSRILNNLNNLYNYTGLVANNLSTEFGKPCIVLCDTGYDIKASFRDYLSRGYLKTFKMFCKAEGHPAAFAIKLTYEELPDFMYHLREIVDKKYFIYKIDEPIEINCEGIVPDDRLLNNMALYNEFSGIDYPVAIVSKKNNMKVKKTYNKYYCYEYKWGDHIFYSKNVFVPNYTIKLKPVKKSKLNLIVYNRGC